MSNLPRVGITHGNINGTSCEMILRLLADAEILEICTPVIFGSKTVLDEQAKALNIPPVAFNVVAAGREPIDGKINLVPVCPNSVHTHWGERDADADKAETMAWLAALEAYDRKAIDLLVTTPGDLTDPLSDATATAFLWQHLDGDTSAAHRCFVTDDARLAVLPIATADDGTTFDVEAVIGHLRDISQSLRRDIGELRPRIAVTGDFPTLPAAPTEDGTEQSDSPVRTAFTALHEEGILAFGPFSPDQVIADALYRHYDIIAALDDAATLEKLSAIIDTDTAVGYTAGLPIVHTYPLAEASYETAGQGVATADALRTAIYVGIDILRARCDYAHATRSPLEKQWIPKGRDDYKLDLTKDDGA